MNPPLQRPRLRTTRRGALICVSVLAMIVLWMVVTTLRRSASLPSYQGRRLDQWLLTSVPADFRIPTDVFGHIHDELWQELESPEPPIETVDPLAAGVPAQSGNASALSVALEQMGAKSMPLLLAWIVSEPTRWERTQQRFFYALPPRMRAWPWLQGFQTDPASRRQEAARRAFEILGPRAGPALHSLSNQFFHVRPDFPLAWAMASVGEPGLRLLMHAVESGPGKAREAAALSLGIVGRSAVDTTPALISAVEQGDFSYHVLGALGRLECRDPRLTASLVRRLESGAEFTPYRMEVLLLGLQRAGARAALPELVRRYHAVPPGDDANDRRLLLRVIRVVDPAVAAPLALDLPRETRDTWP